MISKGISVFLVTANRLLRETLAKVLSSKGAIQVRGVSACISDAHAAILDSGAEILILDSILPGMAEGGRVTEFLPGMAGVKIMLIDMEEDQEVFLACVRAGAVGYMVKDASAAEVLSAICAIAHGQTVYPAQISLPLLQTISLQQLAIPGLITTMRYDLGLTRRQQQLVPLIAQGLTNKEIASHLNLSEQTIKNHVHNMLRRVGANSRIQIADVSSRQQQALG